MKLLLSMLQPRKQQSLHPALLYKVGKGSRAIRYYHGGEDLVGHQEVSKLRQSLRVRGFFFKNKIRLFFFFSSLL